ncbi:putative holin-like toxin [Kineothrix sedimenti]|uniref:Holin-like toxin n=1 Tax=Kineothrix sedimenti TaxID=3123317 RepID=A0ABZ3EYB3_9FIRM
MFIMDTYQTLSLIFQFGGFLVALLVYVHKTK